MSTSTVLTERRNALEEQIIDTIYRAGALTIRGIADRVGRSKSPALRKVLAEMCEHGILKADLYPYKSNGMYVFRLADRAIHYRDQQDSFIPSIECCEDYDPAGEQ